MKELATQPRRRGRKRKSEKLLSDIVPKPQEQTHSNENFETNKETSNM